MRYGARMTVHSSPSSKHVPRKERRYHVKTSNLSNKKLWQNALQSGVKFLLSVVLLLVTLDSLTLTHVIYETLRTQTVITVAIKMYSLLPYS